MSLPNCFGIHSNLVYKQGKQFPINFCELVSRLGQLDHRYEPHDGGLSVQSLSSVDPLFNVASGGTPDIRSRHKIIMGQKHATL